MIRQTAPAKVNLVLQVGDVRDDGLHELCSLFASLELADELTIEPLEEAGRDDEVVCPGVGGPNLAARAIAELRAALDDHLPPLRVTIDRLTPGEVPERGRVRVAGTVRNRSDEPWRNLTVYLLRDTEPITDTATLATAAEAGCVDAGTRVIDPFVSVPDLDPGESTSFRLSSV